MQDISWLLFVGASLVVIVAPGQDMVLVMVRGLGQGRGPGWSPRPASAPGCP